MVKPYNILFFVCIFVFNALFVKSNLLENEIREYSGLLTTETIPGSVTSFSVNLLQALTKNIGAEENILISPVNAYGALLLLHLGAGDLTRKSLHRVLRLPENMRDPSTLHEKFRYIFHNIQQKPLMPDEAEADTTLANGLFVQSDIPIYDSFLQSLNKYYVANVTNVNFAEKATAATEAINSYIAEATRKRINKFYKAPLPSSTLAVLVSALYFKGTWRHVFDKEQTKSEKFNTGTAEIEVPMMRRKDFLLYSYSDALQFDSIEIRYYGGEFSMLIQLPRHGQTARNLTQHLHLIDVAEVSRNSKFIAVDYKIPRMKFSWDSSLVEPLQLGNIFADADLSLMTGRKITVSEMKQATDIEIDENGTVATAAVTIGVSRSFGPPPVRGPFQKFYIDRPFLLSIVHRPTQMILYSGLIQKPITS